MESNNSSAEIAALVHRHAVEREVSVFFEFGVHIRIRYAPLPEHGGQDGGFIPENGRKHDGRGREAQQLDAGFAERIDVILVVQDRLDAHVEGPGIGLGLFGAAGGHFPVLAGVVAGQQQHDAPVLVVGEDRGVDVRLIADVLDDAHHVVVTPFRDIAPVVEHAVHGAPRDAGHPGHVLERDFPFVFFHGFDALNRCAKIRFFS